MKTILVSAAGNPENQDCGIVVESVAGTVLCVADGAGGRSGAREAAMMATQFVRENAENLKNAQDCSDLLLRMDKAVAKDPVAGETTCVVAVVTADEIFGASVGDSCAWLITESGERIDLTDGQQRKPVVGSGSAWPRQFSVKRERGRLLLATDGLIKYTSAERIVEACQKYETGEAAKRLIELVRYQSGALPDDVTVILAEIE